MQKVALVTGAGGRIGRSIALTLADHGYDVGLNYLNSFEQAKEVQRQVEAKGRKGVLLRANVASLKEINAMFDELFAEFDHIDLLVNNAGITRFSSLLDVTEEMWDAITFTDWKGAFFCAQRAAKNMVEKGVKGVIINITSNHQDGCWPKASVYGPTKAALMKFTRNAALELAKYGIRVNAIAPGYTYEAERPDSPYAKKIYNRIPLGRFATPEEIAGAVVYLASEKASYITGTCLTIDGGALLPVITENEYPSE